MGFFDFFTRTRNVENIRGDKINIDSSLHTRQDQQIDTLIDALTNVDNSKDVRQNASNTLAKIGVPAIEPLISALLTFKGSDRPMIYARDAVSTVIKEIGSAAADPLIDALNNTDNKDHALTIIRCLETIGGQKIIDALFNVLNTDTRMSVQLAAIEVIGKIGVDYPSAVDLLINHLNDSRFNALRATIAETLGNLKDARAIPALIETLKTVQSSDDRASAAIALNRLKWKPSDPLLEAYQAFAQNLGNEKMISNLCHMPRLVFKETLPFEFVAESFQFLIKNGSSLKICQTGLYLMRHGDSRAINYLFEYLGSPFDNSSFSFDHSGRRRQGMVHFMAEIVKALGNSNDPRLFDAMLKATEHSFWRVRKEAAVVLGKLGDPRAIPSLEKLRNDPGDEVVTESEADYNDRDGIRTVTMYYGNEEIPEAAMEALNKIRAALNNSP